MCGRYTLTTDVDELVEVFDAPPLDGVDLGLPRYNIAPTQEVPVVAEGRPGRRTALFRWGLVPRWADDPSIGNRMINARSETVDRRTAFRDAFRDRRCVVPADGFYEWLAPPEGERGPKRPYWFHRPDGRPFALAGLWERWEGTEGELLSFTILTTDANEEVAPVHERMPVVLPDDRWERWLEADADPSALEELVGPAPSGLLEAREVRTVVNSPANDGPECIEPVDRDGA